MYLIIAMCCCFARLLPYIPRGIAPIMFMRVYNSVEIMKPWQRVCHTWHQSARPVRAKQHHLAHAHILPMRSPRVCAQPCLEGFGSFEAGVQQSLFNAASGLAPQPPRIRSDKARMRTALRLAPWHRLQVWLTCGCGCGCVCTATTLFLPACVMPDP
jgi:hypothetical protein